MSGYDFTPTGWYATFDHKRSRGGIRRRDVEAWSDEGDALAVDQERGRLVVVHTMPGFQRLMHGDKITAMVPAAPGWRVRQVEEGEPPSIGQVIAWALCGDYFGTVLPVTAGTGWTASGVADVANDENLTLLAPGTPDTDPEGAPDPLVGDGQ